MHNRKQKNVLLISYHYDLMDTNALCLEPLITRLLECNYRVHVVCCNSKPKRHRAEDQKKGIFVYPVRSKWQRMGDWVEAKLHFDNADHIGIVRRSIRYSLRRFPSYKRSEQRFILAGVRVAEQLISNLRITNILSISNPICNHQLAFGIKKGHEKIRWMMYQLDPYADNHSLDNAEKDKRYALEYQLWAMADKIVITDEMSRASQGKDIIIENKQKILSVPLPNFEIRPRSKIRFSLDMDSTKTNLVFAGNIYGNFRDPTALLEIIARVNNPDIICHIYGWGMEKYLDQYPMLRNQIVVHGRVPKDDLLDALFSASVLINFGNKMPNQTPSKVFDYIATGKPIVNFCYDEKDTSLYYLGRYPLFLNIFNEEVSSDKVVLTFANFCINSKDKLISRDKLQLLYGDLLSEQVCSLIVEHMVR